MGKPSREIGYIDDRSLLRRDDDKFTLAAVADELANLVSTQPLPLSVAVFGPWGSGKSSLGTLLRDALATKEMPVRFVRVDAWKYSKDSFRRQFIMRSAADLGLKEEKYRNKLYTKSKTSRLTIPWKSIWKLVGTLAVIAVTIILFLAAVGAGLVGIRVATTDRIQFLPLFTRWMLDSLPAAFISAAALTALFGFMGKMFVSDLTESEVSSDEHFEQTLADLVGEALSDDASAERICFYVDELDRCDARSVVDVLEGIRTFLDLPNCVFVVAADNRVLELAVQQVGPHAVPDEESNPYYSSGAEYLDKLFQHQLTIPAVLPHRLTSFALALVAELPGVWHIARERGDLENIVSVLIPSHVNSPRRVKVLLNGFVSIFQIARARHASDPVGVPDPVERLPELAKLSTLRLEYPLFYRDLIRYPRLASHLTAYLHNHSEWSEQLRKEAEAYGDADLVEEYALCSRPADEMLCSDREDVVDSESDSESAAVVGPSASDLQHRNELIAYLRKTARVPGPTRDMVFLESAGSTYGIPGDLAELVEFDAINSNLDALASRVEELDSDQRIGVVRLLHLTRRQMVGIEATNALAAAFFLIDKRELVQPGAIADELLPDILEALAADGLELEWIPAATIIALAAKSAAGIRLAESLLNDDRLVTEDGAQTALGAIRAIGEEYGRLLVPLGKLLFRAGPGFISLAISEDVLSGHAIALVVAESDLLKQLRGRWSSETSEVDIDDIQTLSAALREADVHADWRLAQSIAECKSVDAIDAWLAAQSPAPTDSKQTATLLRLASQSTRTRWIQLEPALKNAPATDAVTLYSVAARLLRDLEIQAPDDCHTSLRSGLDAVWGQPSWPQSWPAEPHDFVVTPSWSDSETRFHRHEFVRHLARRDSQTEAYWVRALALNYEAAIRSELPSSGVVDALGLWLVDDWSLFAREERDGIVEALMDPACVLPIDVRRLWHARIALVDEAVSFPFGPEESLTLAQGSAVDSAAVELWLESVAAAEDIEAFVSRDEYEHPKYLAAVVDGSSRLASGEAARIAIVMISRGAFEQPQDISDTLQSADDEMLADWMAEQLRSRPEAEREGLLEVWEVWPGIDDVPRRTLIDAFLHVASSGRTGLESAIRHMRLVSSPPHGTKGRIVETLRERAKSYDLERETEDALLAAGLIKKVRKGLFRQETVISEDESGTPTTDINEEG